MPALTEAAAQRILYFRRRLSAIMAINSLFVGFPRLFCIVYPKYEFRVSMSPRSHATSIAWRIARSTREVVVEYFFATDGYSTFVTELIISLSLIVISIAVRRY